MRTPTRSDWQDYWWIVRPFVLAIALVIIALWVLASLACATAAPAVTPGPPVPPRSDATPWIVGVVGDFYAQIPDGDLDHIAAWTPLLRAPVTTAAQATKVLDDVNGRFPVLLLVETVDLPLVQALGPIAGRAWGVELGNELNGPHDPSEIHAFTQQAHDVLRAAGFTGQIVSGGLSNIDPASIQWITEAMAGWPADVVIGWHAYSNWQPNIPAFVAAVGNRPHLMTEWGEPGSSDDAQAAQATTELSAIKASGAIGAIRYQIEDGPVGTSGYGYGLHAADGHWRPTEGVLAAAQGATPTPPPPPVAETVGVDLVFCASAPVDNYCSGVKGATVNIYPVAVTHPDDNGYLYIQLPKDGLLEIAAQAAGFNDFDSGPYLKVADLIAANDRGEHNFFLLTPAMPPPPTKAQLMAAQYTFQGLRASCPQYDARPIPIFDPMLDVVDDACKQAILDAHRAAGDQVVGVAISHQYSEPGIIPILAAGHDWTTDLPGLHAFLLDLIQRGFYPQLHLAMDGHSVKDAAGHYVWNDPVGHTYGCEWGAQFFPQLADALDDIHAYIRFLPGYDGIFYGCEDDGQPIKIPAFAAQFKARWPDGVLGLEFNAGHLPFGEGDADWQPNGRMRNFDMVFAEFDSDLNQDSTWQIVARLMKHPGDYHRPPEQPSGDDPSPPAYLRNWPGVAVCFEWDTYDDVRFQATPASVATKRAKLRAMGCPFTG